MSGIEGNCRKVPADGCSICGLDSCVTNKYATFNLPGQPSRRCGDIENDGYDGIIPLDQCPFILQSNMPEKCGCSSSSPQQQSIVPCLDVPEGGCSVCGPGLCVTDYDGIYTKTSSLGQPNISCRILEAAGYDGIVPLDECPSLPSEIYDICKCRNAIPLDEAVYPTTKSPATISMFASPPPSSDLPQQTIALLVVGTFLAAGIILGVTCYTNKISKRNQAMRNVETAGMLDEDDISPED